MEKDFLTDCLIREYIGDGVYAEYDGHVIWLRVNSHTSPRVVALEPEVLESLNRFDKKCREKRTEMFKDRIRKRTEMNQRKEN